MIELGTRPVVVLQAAPFCFGPISTTLAVAKHLRQRGYALVWLAEETSLQLLQSDGAEDYVIPFSLSAADDRRRCAHIIEEADAVLVNTDPDFAEFALGLTPNIVYLDILYWMWDRLPDAAVRVAKYVFEDFAHTDEQIERVGLPANALRVGPLAAPAHVMSPARRGRHLLVSLGGLWRPGNRSALESYRDTVHGALFEALKDIDGFEEVFVAGGEETQRSVTLASGHVVHFGVLAKDRYLDLLATARAAILAPGLTGFYEVAAARTPVFFLPPHNYSQHLQLDYFKRLLLPGHHCDWGDLGQAMTLGPHLSETAMLRIVDAQLANSTAYAAGLSQHLHTFLDMLWRRYDPEPCATYVETLAARGDAPLMVADEVSSLIGACSEKLCGQTREAPRLRKLTLEIFGGCQLRCPLCPTGNRTSPGRATGALSPSDAARIIDEVAADLEVVELFNWGEPFLNPHACEIIRLIADRGIKTVVSSNLQVMPAAHELLASGLDELIVSCHGVTQPVYGRYMVRGKVEKTFANLDALCEAMAIRDAKLKVRVRYVVFAHNEHELSAMRERFSGTPIEIDASPMRVDMRNEILRPASVNIAEYESWIPASSRFYDKERGTASRAPIGCNLPFEEMVIDVDGSASVCCSSFDRSFDLGNLLDQGVKAVWNGPKYDAARRIVRGRALPGDNVLCRTCKANGYRDF